MKVGRMKLSWGIELSLFNVKINISKNVNY